MPDGDKKTNEFSDIDFFKALRIFFSRQWMVIIFRNYYIKIVLVARAPGKRQIKPTAQFFESQLGADEDEEEDVTFACTFKKVINHDKWKGLANKKKVFLFLSLPLPMYVLHNLYFL